MKIICPGCKWSADVPDKKVPADGGKGTCPKCQAKFEVKREGEPNLVSGKSTSASTAKRDTKSCPLCGEKISSEAKKCKHCHNILDVVIKEDKDNKTITKPCENCNGSGQVNFQQGYFNVKKACQYCDGTGETVDNSPDSVDLGKDNIESNKIKDLTSYNNINNLQSSTSSLDPNRELLNKFMDILKTRNS